MCGINGFNFPDQDLVLRMNRTTRHRGPDHTATWVGDHVSLGHNRLSIIDLSDSASQPMVDDAGECVIVHNGEIYNFQDLRRELEPKYRFRSHSDTEVILYAYKEYGPACVARLNGIFAFAIWDRRSHQWLLARDKMGVKPLYYYADGRRFIFSSEIKAILEHDVPRDVDVEAFRLYVRLLYTPEPHTMLTGIKKLPAASYLVSRGSTVTIERYWTVERFEDLPSRSLAQADIRRLFRDAVKRQLVSDRPVGVFLSGGMDSTAVLGAMHDMVGHPIKTFSVGFDVHVDADKFNADLLLARQTASVYGTEHLELVVTARDMLDELPRIVWHLDEPNANPTAGATFLLSRHAKGHVAVVLGGDGGDELFGGYPRYYLSRLISLYQSMPWPMRVAASAALTAVGRREALAKLRLPPASERIVAFSAQHPALLSEVLARDATGPDGAEAEAVSRYFDERLATGGPGIVLDFEKHFMDVDRQTWLVDESLARTDKMTMAFGLEERVPILDERLVELAYRIPTRWKVPVLGPRPPRFQGKRIWRQALSPYLPPHTRRERKRGWFTPMAKWLRSPPFSDLVEATLSPPALHPGFFDARGVHRVWRDHREGKRYNLNVIWAILSWQLWYDRFVKGGHRAA